MVRVPLLSKLWMTRCPTWSSYLPALPSSQNLVAISPLFWHVRDKERRSSLAWPFAVRLEQEGYWTFKGETIRGQDHHPLPPFGYPSDWVPNVHHPYSLLCKGATTLATSRQGFLLSKQGLIKLSIISNFICFFANLHY